MKILLCCAGGFSTNMMMQRMREVVKNSQKLDSKDFEFDAIPADALEDKVDGWDVVLIGPQITHKIEHIKTVLDPKGIPCAVIDKDVYGEMDGATVLKLALVTYKKSKLAK